MTTIEKDKEQKPPREKSKKDCGCKKKDKNAKDKINKQDRIHPHR